MFKKSVHNSFLKKETVLLIFLYLSLLISFVIGENSTGGAILDYNNQKNISEEFSINFINTLLTYDNFTTRHSPILIIVLSFFEKINIPDSLIRIIHLHFCLLIPFFFYKCLQTKFENSNENIFYFLLSLIFLSPTFRSLSIWPDSRLIGLLFFTVGVLYYLKFLNDKKFYNVVANIFFIALSAYFSPNFSVFSIFFFFQFLLHFKIISKECFYIFVLNLVLSLPAIYYIFILDINFMAKSAAIGTGKNEKIIFNNLFNDILITFSIIFYYLLPFIFFKIIKIDNVFNFKNLIISISVWLICINYFDYVYSYSGGGVFFKSSNFLFQNNFFFYFISLIAIMIITPLLIKNKFNFLLFILIILNNPQYTIYHKYFDPFLIISFFTIFKFETNMLNIFHKKNYVYIFLYFLVFLVVNNFKPLLWNI